MQFLPLGNFSVQLGIFQPIGEKNWYWKPDPVKCRKKALYSEIVFVVAQCCLNLEALHSLYIPDIRCTGEP